MFSVRITFRDGFFVGATLAIAAGIYFAWLWRAEHQVRLHTAHLLRNIEMKNWDAVAADVSSDYRDDWNNDRALLSARLRELLGGRGQIQVVARDSNLHIEQRDAFFRAKITIEGEGEIVSIIKERVNPLSAPFELLWRRQSVKPWDWKLVRVSNAELQLPAD
jgi:hypothetical protein